MDVKLISLLDKEIQIYDNDHNKISVPPSLDWYLDIEDKNQYKTLNNILINVTVSRIFNIVDRESKEIITSFANTTDFIEYLVEKLDVDNYDEFMIIVPKPLKNPVIVELGEDRYAKLYFVSPGRKVEVSNNKKIYLELSAIEIESDS